MKKARKSVSLLFILMALVLAACGGSEGEPAAGEEGSAEEPAATGSGEALLAEGEMVTIGGDQGGSATFTVSADESQASYVVNEEFLADALSKLGIDPGEQIVVGTSPGVSGEMTLDFTNPELVENAQFTVDLSQLQSDQDRRDNWLEDNALVTSQFPQAIFVATSVSGLPESYTAGEEISFQLTGDLTVREVTNSVTFDVTATLTGDTIQGSAVLPLQMSDFNITPPDFANTLTVEDSFRIEVELVARTQ